MSTVAWDGKMLAADKQSTSSGTIGSCCKIYKLVNGDVIAFTGSISGGMFLKKWYEDGADPKTYPEFQSNPDKWGSLIILKASGEIVHYEEYPVEIPVLGKFWAWGSGRDNALGAMAFGANAAEAILIAAQQDSGTGGGVDCFSIDGA